MRNKTYYLLSIFSTDWVEPYFYAEFNTKKLAMEYLRDCDKKYKIGYAKIRRCVTVYEE